MSGGCGCDQARRALEEYVHDELRSQEAADIRAHLDNCPACRAEHLAILALTEVVARTCREPAP